MVVAYLVTEQLYPIKVQHYERNKLAGSLIHWVVII